MLVFIFESFYFLLESGSISINSKYCNNHKNTPSSIISVRKDSELEMAHTQFVDELVREYLLFRGFTSTVKAFDTDLKADKDKGFRVDKIVDQILHFISVSDLNGLKEYWFHLDSLVFSKLEIHVQPALRKIEYSLYKLYLVTASQSTGGVRNEKVADFLSKMLPELQGQNEWRDWFMLPYIQKPEENPTFSLYYTRAWQDSVVVSLHNLLATVFHCMPQPTLTSYESDAALVKRLQDEVATLRGKSQPPTEKTSPIGHQSRLAQHSERLSGPAPLVDDFCAAPAPEPELDAGLREARGLRGLLRQMGGSPVMGRRTHRSQSQN